MKRVLVTGGTGFIGRNCLGPLLDRGFEVHAVCHDAPPIDRAGVRWHRADLLASAQLKRLVSDVAPSHLLHMAWIAKPGIYMQSTENLVWLESGLSLLRSFIACGGRRVVAAGTCFEYDWEYGYCREEKTPLQPSTFYGTCKHALQTALAGLSRQSGLSSAWGRIFFLYGPHEHPDRLVSSVIRSMLRGEQALCTPGDQIRDFLHVEDVAGAFVALLDSDVSGAVNIASGRPLAVRDVIHTIAEEIGRSELVKLGALPARPTEPPLLVADTRRLHDEVEFVPNFELQRGIQATIDWWRQSETPEARRRTTNKR